MGLQEIMLHRLHSTVYACFIKNKKHVLEVLFSVERTLCKITLFRVNIEIMK